MLILSSWPVHWCKHHTQRIPPHDLWISSDQPRPHHHHHLCIAISSLLVGHHKHCHWLVSCWWSARTLLTDGGHGDWVESSHTWDLRFVSYRPAPYSPQFDTPLILWAITAIILCKRKPRVDHTNGFGNFIFASDKVAQWKLLHFSPHYDGKERYLLDIWSQVSYYLTPATLNSNTI